MVKSLAAKRNSTKGRACGLLQKGQLIMDYLAYIGYSDLCRLGTGGVWISGTKALDDVIWHLEWPQDIKDALIMATNLESTLTINDLELNGMILNKLIAECIIQDLKNIHIGYFYDNESAVS